MLRKLKYKTKLIGGREKPEVFSSLFSASFGCRVAFVTKKKELKKWKETNSDLKHVIF